jgi:transcriptional regulator with XRE-family HTH domain
MVTDLPDIEDLVREQIKTCNRIGISMTRLAEESGVSRTTLWRWLNENRVPQWATMVTVLRTADELIGEVTAQREELDRMLNARIGRAAGEQ